MSETTTDNPEKNAKHARFVKGSKVALVLQRRLGLPIGYHEQSGQLMMDVDVAAAWLRERGFDG